MHDERAAFHLLEVLPRIAADERVACRADVRVQRRAGEEPGGRARVEPARVDDADRAEGELA